VNLRQLEVFCRIVEVGSFSMAAEDVGLSQPAVSFQIQALEKELGVMLLDRSSRQVLPTESGRILYAHARRILHHADAARREMDELDLLLRGTLLIGASTGPGEHVLPDMLGRFKAEHRQIRVSLRILPTDEIVEQVLSYELEVGIVGARERNPRLHFEPFVHDALVVIASPDHPWAAGEAVTMEMLMQEPFILQQPGAGVRTMLESGLAELGLGLADMNVYMELGLQESIKTAVQAGHGIGLISRLAVGHELSTGTLVEIAVSDLPVFREEFYLVRHRTRKLSRLTETFLEFSRQYALSGLP
jgi:DNA-binding transcriptional LysR family regulator